jgi:DNA-binding transcriptional ArsR family regulator
MDPERLNKVIHERVRLAIMSALAARNEMSFVELKEAISVTDGNLSVHGSILEKHGLISIRKEFVARRPKTTYSITPLGVEEFTKYIKELEAFIKVAD